MTKSVRFPVSVSGSLVFIPDDLSDVQLFRVEVEDGKRTNMDRSPRAIQLARWQFKLFPFLVRGESTQNLRTVFIRAGEEAERFNHNYIGTEHLLLGLTAEGEGIAAQALSNLGLELPKIRSAVKFIIGRGEGTIPKKIGFTPRSKKVIELAIDEKRRLGHRSLGTEHLLLGLIREGEGIAAGILESLGVNLDKAREEVMRVLNDPTHKKEE